MSDRFWSSAVLTGNRTLVAQSREMLEFWSSAVLTGNRTQAWINKEQFIVLEQCRSDW